MKTMDQLPFSPDFCLKEISCRSTKQGEALLKKSLPSHLLGQVFLQEDALFFQWESQSIPFYSTEFSHIVQQLQLGYGVFAHITRQKASLICTLYFFSHCLPVGQWEVQLKQGEKEKIAKIFNQTSATLRDCSPHFTLNLPSGGTGFAYSLGYYPTLEERKAGYDRSTMPTFRLYGKGYLLLLRIIEEEQCLRVVNVEAMPEDFTAPLSLAQGSLHFTPERCIFPDSALRLVKENEGAEYIKLWDSYALEEGEVLLANIKHVGEIIFKEHPKRVFNQERHTFDYVGELSDPHQVERFRQLKLGHGSLLLSTAPPTHLEEDVTWTEYSQRRRQQENYNDTPSFPPSHPFCRPRKPQRATSSRPVEQHCQFSLSPYNHTLVMYQEKNTPLHFGDYPEERTALEEKTLEAFEEGENGNNNHNSSNFSEPEQKFPKVYVTLDLSGDATRIKRRNQARNRMMDGESASPRMAKVMEGKQSSPATPQEILDPLTLDSVLQEIFPQGATSSQRIAVNLALNTPDIALIQGPPGTGKTTVITAVVEGINQELRQDQHRAGEILITSYQHDAVDHVQRNIRTNSLPPVKFEGEERSQGKSAVDLWCEEWMNRFTSTYDVLESSPPLEALQQQYKQYSRNPTQHQGKLFLDYCFTATNDPLLQENIKERLEEAPPQQDNQYLLSRVRKLRCTKSGLLDDGISRSSDVIFALCGDFHSEKGKARRTQARKLYPTLFKTLSLDISHITPDFLAQCVLEKRRLLESCFVMPSKPKLDPALTSIFRSIQREYIQYDQETGISQETLIFKDLLKEMQGQSRNSLQKMMSKYALVYGATLQHSVANPMAVAKLGPRSKFQTNRAISFDTVIVDEAARANPMDLMIAITQGRRRLILVGDHRQLPQVYEEELLERLQEETGITLGLEQSKESMFQYLMTMAKKLETLDGIPRTITLKEQFRMHPLLGEFVSRQFYEIHDPAEAFTSPLPASHFSQVLEPTPVVWLHVPMSAGRSSTGQVRSHNSFKRDLEVDCITDQLCDYLQQEGEECYSYGVISFYNGQKLEILARLEEKKREFPHLATKLEQVEVGTVDSFQGKEFDVMFLSLVRSKPPTLSEKDKENLTDPALLQRLVKKTYGFTTMENRLCVSLSRQKRLLVVVGNSHLYGGDPQWSPLASFGVPSLHALYHLCQSEGSVRTYGS